MGSPTNCQLNPVIDLIAGSIGGCANVLVGQPLDTVKTFLTDGIRRGLYAGTVPALAANVAENSVLFCAYGFCQDAVRHLSFSGSIKESNKQLSPIQNAFAGCLAGFFSSFTLCPTELIKCKLQAARETKSMSDSSAVKLTKSILQTEGFFGLFRGLSPTLAREMPGYFFFFGGYELTKNFLTAGNSESAGFLVTTISGGVGGVCLWTAVFPFDVAKSYIQIQNSRAPMLHVIRDIFRNEGFTRLYKGLSPTLLRTFPSSGVLFVAYEYSKHYMTVGCRHIGLI